MLNSLFDTEALCGTLNFTFPPFVDLGHPCSQIISKIVMMKRSLVTDLRLYVTHTLLYVTI